MALGMVSKLYAPALNYYGKSSTMSEVMTDKANYFKRWPIRYVSPRLDTIQSQCREDMCMITGLYDWQVSNPKKRKTLKGTATFEYGLQTTPHLTVVWEGGAVISK